MEKQVEKIYTIAKFKEFQQELTALMYCDTVDSVGSITEISESLGQGKKKNFEVVFDETECEVSCICSKFQFRGILCRHALSVLIRHGIEILPEMYILSRWRKDVKRCYSKVKVSYGMQNLSIQQERYDKMCTDFSEVANIAADDESSYKFVLDWINKTMKDLSKQIRCASVETTAIGEVSCSSNTIEQINDPVAARRKGRPPCLRKQASLRKKPAQKNKTAEKNKVCWNAYICLIISFYLLSYFFLIILYIIILQDLQENASASFEMANEVSTQQSNMAMVFFLSFYY